MGDDLGDAVSWRVIGDELFAVNLQKQPEQHLEPIISFYCRVVTLTPDRENGGPTECTLSSRKCCCLSSARLPWRRSCMQACILASTLQASLRKCPLDEKKNPPGVNRRAWRHKAFNF
jgi:hypothetical protein